MRAEIERRKDTVTEVPRILIEGLRKGDQKAQLQVYKICYRQIFGICLNLKSDPAAAEDLMHESFLLAFENIGNYSGDISFTSWTINYIKDACQKLENCLMPGSRSSIPGS